MKNWVSATDSEIDKMTNREAIEILQNCIENSQCDKKYMIKAFEIAILAIIEQNKYNTDELINDMQKYLDDLKKMPREKAIETSKKNLIGAGIIDEYGNVTDRYAYNKTETESKK